MQFTREQNYFASWSGSPIYILLLELYGVPTMTFQINKSAKLLPLKAPVYLSPSSFRKALSLRQVTKTLETPYSCKLPRAHHQ